VASACACLEPFWSRTTAYSLSLTLFLSLHRSCCFSHHRSPKLRDGAQGRGAGHAAVGDLSPVQSPVQGQVGSPSGQPPQASRSSSSSRSRGSAERKDSLGSISTRNDDDDYGDVGGGGDYMDNDDDAMSSASKGRRVSFGDGTKSLQDAAASSGQAKRRGRPPSRPTKPKTPGSGSGSARTTPDSARSARTDLSTPGSDDFPRGRKVQDDTFRNSDEEAEEEDAVDRTDVQDTDSDDGT